ncbi:MAG: hypothetical protein WBJ43_06935 [Smithellaceae bacterium]
MKTKRIVNEELENSIIIPNKISLSNACPFIKILVDLINHS